MEEDKGASHNGGGPTEHEQEHHEDDMGGMHGTHGEAMGPIDEALDVARAFVRQRPVASLLVAVVAGYLVGRLLRV